MEPTNEINEVRNILEKYPRGNNLGAQIQYVRDVTKIPELTLWRYVWGDKPSARHLAALKALGVDDE